MIKINKILDRFLILTFLLIIFIPNIGLFQNTNEIRIKASLNRDVYKFPNIEISQLELTDFSAIEKWYVDKIYFFTYLNQVWSNLNYKFGISTKPDLVIIGKNNWLFLGNYFGATIDQYTGVNHPSEEEMLLMVKSFSQMSNIAKQHNIPFLVVVAPDKQDIYPELLPDYIGKRSNTTRLDLLGKMLPLSHVDFIDLREAEILAKEFFNKNLGPIYLSGDSHWNFLGAYSAYICICKYLANKFDINYLNKNKIKFKKNKTNSTDLTNFLQIKNVYSSSPLPDTSSLNIDMLGRDINGKIRKMSPYERNENNILSKEPYENINMKLKNKNNLLLISDSFSNDLGFYFHNDFYNTIRIHHCNTNYNLSELIKSYNPKVIIFQIVERELINYTNNFAHFVERVNYIQSVNSNEITAHIDFLNQDKNHITISGWGYLHNKDAFNSDIYLRLSNTKDSFDFLLNTGLRIDIKQNFNNGSNLGLSGFSGKIKNFIIPPGRYKASIIIVNGSDSIKKDFDLEYQLY